jgi:hypothetical protein
LVEVSNALKAVNYTLTYTGKSVKSTQMHR